MGRRFQASMIVVAMGVALGACSGTVTTESEINQGPVGIGRGINELKGTPCACTEIPMALPSDWKV